MKNVLRIFAVMLITSGFVSFSFAEVVEEPEGSIDTVSDLAMLSIVAAEQEGQANVVSEEPAPVAEDGPPQVQDTYNMQDGISGDVLQAAENPEGDTASDSEVVTIPPPEPSDVPDESEVPIVLGEATSTESDGEVAEETEIVEEVVDDVVIPGPASLEVVVEDVIADSEVNPDVVAEVQVIVPTPVESVAQIPFEEEKGFAFALTGKNIPTMQRLYTFDGEVIDEKEIHDAPTLTIDEDGAMTVAGACWDAYYVVLLYKDADDYQQDPRSYILNRAYECTGSFSYAMDNLPPSLPNGTYYLLIGEQGEVGEWVPITSLTEITINRE